jgi:hypothetical protein
MVSATTGVERIELKRKRISLPFEIKKEGVRSAMRRFGFIIGNQPGGVKTLNPR